MRTSNQPALGRIRTQMSRVLACVLLAGIIYTATAGAVHSHGSALYGFDSITAVDITGQSGVSPELPLSSRSDGNQCLICVLHRQFSNSIIHSPFFVAELPTAVELDSAATTFSYSNTLLSRPIARHSGRAPPQGQA